MPFRTFLNRPSRLFRLALLAGAVSLLSGCSTVQSRIAQQPELFARLAPDVQQQILNGQIDLGFTPELVRMALGSPDVVEEITTDEGVQESWIYNRYSSRYAGRQMVGHRPVYYIDPKTGNQRVLLEPDYVNVYRRSAEPDVRLVFENGRVAVIEQRTS